MKLKKISARNFKGLTFSLELTDMNLLVGGNFAGKSARTDAIRLVLIGYLPELGKTPRATFGLSSGKDMQVTGEFSDGSIISRRWWLKGDAVSCTSQFPAWYEEDSPMLTVMLNAETYFALSERERVNYVAANLSNCMRVPDIEKEIFEATKQFDDVQGTRVFAFLRKIQWGRTGGAVSVSECVAGTLENCRVEESEARAHALRMEKSIQGLAALRTMDVQTQNLTYLDSRKATLEADLRALYELKAASASAFDAARNNRARRQALVEGIRGKETVIARRDAATNRIDALEHELSQIEIIAAGDMENLRIQDKEASVRHGSLRAQKSEVDAAIRRNEAELAGLNEKTTCPYCGAAGDGWKQIKTREINSALAGLTVKEEQIVNQIIAVRGYAETISRRVLELAEATDSRHAILAKIATLVAGKGEAETMLALIEAREQELASMPAEDPNVQATSETLASAIVVKSQELKAVETARTSAIARESELRRLAQFETERDAAKIDQQVAATAAETLRGIQRKMVEDAFVPLIETANGIFGSVLRSPLAYNADNAEIGTWRDGVWVGHKTFSGTEKALCYAAIQAALAARSPVKLMIIDELGRLDDYNIESVLDLVDEAIYRGEIYSFIGIDTGRQDLYTELSHTITQVLTVTAIA